MTKFCVQFKEVKDEVNLQIFNQMQNQQIWPFPLIVNPPNALIFSPQVQQAGEQFINPFLGYPNCPLIGRYNQGEYRIAETIRHFQFNCEYDNNQAQYKCGPNSIHLPEKIVYNLRNIPEEIKHNKPANQAKNSKIQNFKPIKYPVLNNLKFTFIITFGQLGKDFLNYLNHMYTLGHELFVQQRLRKSAFSLPIYAYLPAKSGIMQEQVDKGLSLSNYRSQFLSLHLKYGAPAFSPNNMRLGIQGMKKVVSNPPAKKDKHKKHKLQDQSQHTLDSYLKRDQLQKTIDVKTSLQKQINKDQANKKQLDIVQIPNSKQESDIDINWAQIEKQISEQKLAKQLKYKPEENKQQDSNKQGKIFESKQLEQQLSKCEENTTIQINTQKQEIRPKPQQKKEVTGTPAVKHKGFVHFYTSVLLQNDYRVYYHWHVDKFQRRDIIQSAMASATSLKQFLANCQNLLGYDDQLVMEVSKIFGIHQ